MSNSCNTLGVLLLLLPTGTVSAESPIATFTLEDHLNRRWNNELVFFPVAASVFGRNDVALVGPGGEPVPFQWVSAEISSKGKPSIAFAASVPEFGQSVYRLIKGKPAGSTALAARLRDSTVVLQNGLVGITLGGPLAAKQGPIVGIRLQSGRTVAGGELHVPAAPTVVRVSLPAAGPVFAEAAVDYEFPDHRYWRLRFRVIANEPVVLVHEQFQLPIGAEYTLKLADRWGADQLFYRDNGNRCRIVSARTVGSKPIFRIEPWPAWWGEQLRANWLTVFQADGSDLLAVGACEPGVWVLPERTDWDTALTVDERLEATFQLQGFGRKWVLAALKRADAVRDEEVDQAIAPLPQQHVIRHGDFPLDTVKDYTLTWDDRGTRHPRLFTTASELERFRKRFTVNHNKLAELRNKDVYGHTMDDHVSYFLATGDRELGRKLADFAIEQLQQAIDGYVRQEKLRNPGCCPHHRNSGVLWGAIAADLALGCDVLSAEERARIKAQLAMLAYTVSRPLVISPERGYHANPNMTTMTSGMLGIVACTIPRHDDATKWARVAIAEMEHELTEWCGPGGGWLEAPHYATASLDTLVSLALGLRETGLTQTQWHFHPKLRAAATWLAKISTPPDPRLDGSRHMPAIGNSYLGEPTCLPGWMATIWRDKDPAFARQLQWMWKAQGTPKTPGIGGAYPGLQGYRHVMLDESLPAAAPAYQSELFPEAGAVLRAHFPSRRETYLHYIQGKMHQHYDFDEGSFILWGKGQPLCEEFGYYGRAPAADHSRIDDGFYEALGAEGSIREFTTGPSADYLRGERHGWHRQILFVKDRHPIGPNYFVIRDAVLHGRNFDWRVWIATDEAPRLDQNPVRIKGRFDTDLIVFFLDGPKSGLATETATRTAGTAGWGHDKRTSTQRSLWLKQVPAAQPVSVVLYPVLRDQSTPRFTALSGGRVAKIESSFGTDYTMLGLEQFQFEAEGISFDGKAGAVQVRRDGARLSLVRRGWLSYRGKNLQAGSEPDRTLSQDIR